MLALDARYDAQHGLGLVGMRERAMLVGATLLITSSPGSGCSVALSLPLSESKKSSSPLILEHPI